LQQNPFIV